MSSLQILFLGALAGSTILLGLPLGRIASASVGAVPFDGGEYSPTGKARK